jgi:4-hydroxybenzoate polyprenyltransferase
MMFRRIFEIAKYYRVNDWIHYLGYVLLSSILVSNIKLINFITSAIILAYAYSINDYYDKKMKNKYFLAPLILYWLIVPFISYFSFIISLSFLILFTLYSWPKVWLEGRPIISTIANSIGFTLIFLLPFQDIEKIINNFSIILIIFFLNSAAQLLHEIVDFKEDKKINKITTTVYFGVEKSLIFFKICLLFVIILTFFILRKFLLISLSSIVFSLYFIGKKNVNVEIRKNFKIIGIIVGVVYILDLVRG